MVFPLVNHSGMFVSSRILFISVCRGWRKFLTSIDVCHQGLAFSNLEPFWVLLWMNRRAFSPRIFIWILEALFRVIYPISFSVAQFSFKIVLFPLHTVVGMSSCILRLLASRIFLHYFGMSSFVCVVLSCVNIDLVFFSPVFSHLFPRVVSSVITALLFFSSLISHPGSKFLFVFFRGTLILALANYAAA